MDPVDGREKGKGTDRPQFVPRHSSRITPLTPTVLLPEIDSDDDEEDGTSVTSSSTLDDKSLASGPDVDVYKHVRFTPSVLANNSADSSERGSSFSNTLGLRPVFDYDAGKAYRAMPSGLGGGKGTAGRGTTNSNPMKTVRSSAEEGREKNMEIWYPRI
jgi:hypothetical protein